LRWEVWGFVFLDTGSPKRKGTSPKRKDHKGQFNQRKGDVLMSYLPVPMTACRRPGLRESLFGGSSAARDDNCPFTGDLFTHKRGGGVREAKRLFSWI